MDGPEAAASAAAGQAGVERAGWSDEPGPVFSRAQDPAERRRLLIEVAVVLALAALLDTVNALWVPPDMPTFGFAAESAFILTRAAQVCVPLLYILHLTGDGLRGVGLARFVVPVDLVGAVLLVVVTQAVGAVLTGPFYALLPPEGTEPASSEPAAAWHWGLAVVAHAANALAEELAIWGFLYTRLRRLLGTEGLPMFLAAGVFASYHVYQGVAAALLILVLGLVHGVFFRLTGRLMPLVIAHAATNLWSHVEAGMV
ncbi:MAG TPA: CPBP family intramembrane glutamic endopeptidase [Phycisphaerales bacterium]|nr:CPBP family intramembrane glutamic endopeptidase [Phycisphaerales bacterium]